jgi:hypothetical protein
VTLRAKQRLTALALSAFAIWPLVHHGLVIRYDITPWKFMGFAMYCVPKLEPLVDVYAYYGERRSEVDMRGAHMRDLRREVARFATFRPVWGELLLPDRVGETAASVLSRADKIEVVVTKGYLDDETWRVAARESIYAYRVPPPPPLGDGNFDRRGRAGRPRAKGPLGQSKRAAGRSGDQKAE